MSLQSIQNGCADFLIRLKKMEAACLGANATDILRKLSEAREQIERLKTESSQPVRVGVVGVFNSGKTRLIEALLGCAGQLFVVDKPATGNIVEFELQAGDVKQTQLCDWRVSVMREYQDAAPILNRLLSEARSHQNYERSKNSSILELDQALFEADFEENEPPRWTKAQEWAKLAHVKARTDQLKAIAFEVYRLAYTIGQAEDWLGREYRIQEKDAISLMSIDYDPKVVFSQSLAEIRHPIPIAPQNGEIKDLPVHLLKALFPIVRKIKVTAKLPAFVAETFGGDHLDFRLVDCPGAGAHGSNFRDTILCAQELNDVDTVFALLNAKNPGENQNHIDELLKIWGSQAKERILAMISRFDELPHNKDNSAGKRDQLAEAETPLKVTDLLGLIPPLQSIYDAAKHLVMDGNPERICYLSSMGYISERLQTEKKGLRGTVNFYQTELHFPPQSPKPGTDPWDQTHQLWVREMEKWAGVAERLKEDTDRNTQRESKLFGEQLSDFAVDGGFSRLQKTLQTHLSKHGQANQLARLMPQRSQLQKLVLELESEVGKLKVVETKRTETTSTPTIATADAIHFMCNVYQSFFVEAKSDSQQYKLIRKVSGSVKTEEILPLLRRGLIGDICRWNEWKLLLKRIGQTESGLVEFVDPMNPAIQKRELDLIDEKKTPVKSDDFKSAFLGSLTKLQKNMRQRLLNCLILHGENLKSSLESRIANQIPVDQLDTILRNAGSTLNPLSNIGEMIGTHWLSNYLPEENSPVFLENMKQKENYFPLQHGKDPLYYAWHAPLDKKWGQNFDKRHRHLMYVIRLRQTLINAALAWLEDLTYQVEKAMRESLSDHLRKVQDDLKKLAAKFPLSNFTDDYAD